MMAVVVKIWIFIGVIKAVQILMQMPTFFRVYREVLPNPGHPLSPYNLWKILFVVTLAIIASPLFLLRQGLSFFKFQSENSCKNFFYLWLNAKPEYSFAAKEVHNFVSKLKLKEELDFDDLDFEPDEHDIRVGRILGKIGAEVTEDTVYKYKKYLEDRLQIPFEVTGAEMFTWEESYFFGREDKNKYEKKKKVWAAHTDKFELIGLEDELDASNNCIVGIVKRKHDGKEFSLPLLDLEGTNKASKNYQLLDDF